MINVYIVSDIDDVQHLQLLVAVYYYQRPHPSADNFDYEHKFMLQMNCTWWRFTHRLTEGLASLSHTGYTANPVSPLSINMCWHSIVFYSSYCACVVTP